jgi:hypothetical protein
MQYSVIESFEPFYRTFIRPFFELFFELFLNFFLNFFLSPSHPLNSPPTICKLCPLKHYNIFFEHFFRTTSLSSLSPFQQFVIKAQFNNLIINFTKKQLKVQFKIQFKIQYKIQFKIQFKIQ